MVTAGLLGRAFRKAHVLLVFLVVIVVLTLWELFLSWRYTCLFLFFVVFFIIIIVIFFLVVFLGKLCISFLLSTGLRSAAKSLAVFRLVGGLVTRLSKHDVLNDS